MSEEPSFISSPFSTKAEYEAWLALAPGAAREEALMRAQDKRGPLSTAELAEALPSTASWGPMEFPAARRDDLAKSWKGKANAGNGRVDIKEVQ